jgi:hypothetical protein
MIEHDSWKHFIPQKGEKQSDKNGLEKYAQRINSAVCRIDKSVLEQSFYGLYNFSLFKNEYCGINYYKTIFNLQLWTNSEIDKIQPPQYGRDYLDDRIQAMKNIDGKIEKSTYRHLTELIKFRRENGTWRVPIIVVKSNDFIDFKYAMPFQLFEGHNRLAWVKYFIHNKSDLELSKKHFVWVLSKIPD